GRVRATPGLETAIGLDPVGHGDLLLAGGEVRAGGEVATARALPRPNVELQAAVVAVARVDRPVAGRLALGDPVPHRGVGGVEAGTAGGAGARRRGGRARRGGRGGRARRGGRGGRGGRAR